MIRDELLSGGRASRAAAARPMPEGGLVKRKRCGDCEGCNAKNCGRCDNCHDMPIFGGKGTKRQSCRDRLCVLIKEEDAKIREEKEKEREARAEEKAKEREQREKEREARGEARAARRSSGAHTTSGSRNAAREARQLQALIGKAAVARLPAVRHDREDMSGGWGKHEAEIGSRVEARLEEEGLDGAVWTGCVVAKGRKGRDEDSDEEDSEDDWYGAGGGERGAAAKKRARREAQKAELSIEFDELREDREEDGDGGNDGGGASSSPLKDDAADSAPLREWVAPTDVRVCPPSGFPTGMAELVRVGDALELYFEDGWWEVEVIAILTDAEVRAAEAKDKGKGGGGGGGTSRSAAAWRATYGEELSDPEEEEGGGKEELPRFIVNATKYNKQHRVNSAVLRPRWLWAAQARAWRFELLNGHGCVPVNANRPGGKPTFTFAHGTARSRWMRV